VALSDPRIAPPCASLSFRDAGELEVHHARDLQRGGFQSVPFINEGQRAPLQVLQFSNASAAYASIGVDSSVTFEEESASQNFEDALATSTFFALENLMVKEEDALVGANKSLKLGQANIPTGSATGSGSLTENLWCAVVELIYEGYRNFTQGTGTALRSN
jgi:hypothetical protein